MGANSQQHNSRERRDGVHEIDSSIEVSVKLAQLRKKVTPLAIQILQIEKKCRICSNLGYGAHTCPYQR